MSLLFKRVAWVGDRNMGIEGRKMVLKAQNQMKHQENGVNGEVCHWGARDRERGGTRSGDRRFERGRCF